MKWNEAAIVLLDPADGTIHCCAAAWRARYLLPESRCFSLPYPKRHRLAGELPQGFSRLGPKSLTFSGRGTKIIIVSHGCPSGLAIGEHLCGAADVAGILAGWGLKRAGLLAFRGCSLGKGAFLDNLRFNLSAANVEVGWLIGYKDVAFSRGIDPGWLNDLQSRTDTVLFETHDGCKHPWSDKRRARPRPVASEAVGFFDRLLREATEGSRKLPDEQRVRIVQGNRFVLPKGGPTRRYFAPETLV